MAEKHDKKKRLRTRKELLEKIKAKEKRKLARVKKSYKSQEA